MKLILEIGHGLSSDNKLLHNVNIMFVCGLESKAVVDYESLVGRRDELLVDVGNTTSGFGRLLNGRRELRPEGTPYGRVTHNILNTKHLANQRGFTNP